MALVVWAASSAAQASKPTDNELIRGAQLCTQQFPAQERMHGIPAQLLAAIAATESGRWNDTLGMVLPWPWTINAEGKGYYFNSKNEALLKVRELQAQGMRSIDIGCMQVNLRHHPDAFANLEEAFNPRTNIAYAAKFLRGHYDEMRAWDKAVAAYHSKTPKYGNKYLARVEKSWSAITGKVRTARAELGGAAAPRNRVTHRVIRVKDTQSGEQFASLNNRSGVYQALSAPKRTSSSDSSGNAQVRKMMKIRDVDRLSGGFRTSTPVLARDKMRSLKAIEEVKSTPNRSNMLVRSAQRSTQPVLTAGRVVNSQNENLTKLSGAELFVQRHGESASATDKPAAAAKPDSTGSKPKFIFVE